MSNGQVAPKNMFPQGIARCGPMVLSGDSENCENGRTVVLNNDTSEQQEPSFEVDQALVLAAMNRDPQALRTLSERLKCVSHILAAQNSRGGRPLGSHDLADLVQNTVVIVLKKLPTYEGRGPLEGWVYRICCLEFLNEVRRQRRLPRPDAEISSRVEEAGGVQEAEDPFKFEELHLAMASLTEEETRLVERKHFDAETFEQIASQLGIPTNTAKTRYYRAMNRLRVLMGGSDGESGVA